MRTVACLGLCLTLGACSKPDDETVKVSGFTLDVDLLAGLLAQHPEYYDDEKTNAPVLLSQACVPNTPVFAEYDDGSHSATILADAQCNYTIEVMKGHTVHLVAAQSGAVLQTFTQEDTVVGTAAVSNVPAHVCTSNPYSAPVGVAKLLGLSPDALVDQGVCMFGTNDHFNPPFVRLNGTSVTVDEPGFEVLALTDPTTMPPTFEKKASSPIGIFGIFKDALATDTSVTIHATSLSGPLTYATATCRVRPGFVTFAPWNPSN
jgi:hypothetical protein